MNHTPAHIFSKSRLNGPEIAFKVAGNQSSEATPSAHTINAAEGSTVIYAAPGATIGSLAGFLPTSFRAEGGSSLLDMSIGDVLRSNVFWVGVTVLGILLLNRGDRRDR